MPTPTPIAFAEVYLALQNETVDAQENPLPTIEAKKFYEVQTHINLTGHITEMLLTIVSGQTWNKLSDADKKIFDGGVPARPPPRPPTRSPPSEAKLVDEFSTKYKKTVVKSDRAAFAKAVREVPPRRRRDLGQGDLRPAAGDQVARDRPATPRAGARRTQEPAMDIDAGPKVMGDDGEFHAVDEAVDLSRHAAEGWVALVLFWAAGRRRSSTSSSPATCSTTRRPGPRRSRATC